MSDVSSELPGVPWASVDLGPPLPMPVHTSTETWNPERIGAMAIYCSDGRWGESFDEFCHKRLLIPRYDRWAVPGGPAWLVPGKTSPELFAATREQIGLLVRVHELTRIVLVTHYGCAFYRALIGKPPDGCLAFQMDDLRSVTKTLNEWFPKINVEAYVAMQRGKCLSFHQVG